MKRETVTNAILFQVLWFASVIGTGIYGLWPLSLLAAGLLLLSIIRMQNWRADLRLATWLVPVGWLLDTLWVQSGIMIFDVRPFAPLWIALLWFGVALSVNHSLSLLRDYPLLGALGVGVFAPFSYLGGAKLGAVVIPEMAPLILVGMAWTLLFLFLLTRARRDRTATARAAGALQIS
jgi:hypothetical protein